MTHQQRLDRLEAYLRENRYADLHTLAEVFNISLSTVRRALNALESRGIVRRHHGGAALASADNGAGYDFITQDTRQTAEKHAIARHIAGQIETGSTIILDGGTTTYAVARLLLAKRVVVITNSLPIAGLFNDVGSSEVIMTGGTVYNRFGVLYGPMCEEALSRMHVDLAVLSGAGLTTEGIWNTTTLIASYQQRMMHAAERSVFGLDHTKFGKRALALVSPPAPNFSIVTTALPPAPLARALAKGGTTVVVIDPAT